MAHLGHSTDVRSTAAFEGNPDIEQISPRWPSLTDAVEKVSKMKLWNWKLKQSNPSKWIFESMLLVRRSP
jgi:hypothetical protein